MSACSSILDIIPDSSTSDSLTLEKKAHRTHETLRLRIVSKHVSNPKPMVLTREYRETVLARIKRDPKFARALYAEAVNALLEGETDDTLKSLFELAIQEHS